MSGTFGKLLFAVSLLYVLQCPANYDRDLGRHFEYCTIESGVHGSPGNRDQWPNMKKSPLKILSSKMDLAESRSS